MQDLLAGLTATLVMFLPRYGAFLAAGALLRWLIRKEQKPWYLTVALLALAFSAIFFLGKMSCGWSSSLRWPPCWRPLVPPSAA